MLDSAGTSATDSGSRLRVLDLLRFCAALAVVMFHFVETSAWGTRRAFPALIDFSMFGVYGVRLFFVISGFVILMSAWGRTSGQFVVSRIARLYPAYWASVVILGGLDSIPGAIIGGLIVGIVENVAAGYIDPYVGGGTKDFAPYVLMIAALMVRPYGIFGKRIIERV